MTDLPVEDASFGTDRLFFQLLGVLSPSPAYVCISVNHQKCLVQFGKMYGAKKRKKNQSPQLLKQQLSNTCLTCFRLWKILIVQETQENKNQFISIHTYKFSCICKSQEARNCIELQNTTLPHFCAWKGGHTGIYNLLFHDPTPCFLCISPGPQVLQVI